MSVVQLLSWTVPLIETLGILLDKMLGQATHNAWPGGHQQRQHKVGISQTPFGLALNPKPLNLKP